MIALLKERIVQLSAQAYESSWSWRFIKRG